MISLAYYLRVVAAMWMRPGGEAGGQRRPGDGRRLPEADPIDPEAGSRPYMVAPALLAAAAVVFFGIVPQPLVDFAQHAGASIVRSFPNHSCCTTSRSRSSRRTWSAPPSSGSCSASPWSNRPNPSPATPSGSSGKGTQVHLMHAEEPTVPQHGHLAVVPPDFERTVTLLRSTASR